LFVVSHIWFILAISTFIKTAFGRQVLFTILTSVPVFLAKIHEAVTLNPSNSQPLLKHLFSLVPFSAFQMTLMSQYEVIKMQFTRFGWGDLYREMSYPTGLGLIWLAVDALIYFVIFLIFNALNDRQFGSAPIGWRGLFNAASWRKLFAADDQNLGRILHAASRMINVQGLRKVYSGDKDLLALGGIDFAIDPGEVIVVIGSNGAGKSTLVNVLSGVTPPTEGSCSIAGMASSFRDVQNQIGVVFQDNVIVPLLSVREHLQLFGAFRGIARSKLEDVIEVLTTKLQLTEVLDDRAGGLSDGQKRKLCIAVCLLGSPPIVIMDEPTAGVDVEARQLIWKTIGSLEETTTIVTSHNLEEAEAVSSRLMILSKGKLPFCGTSAQLRNRFKCGYLLKIIREDGTTGDVLALAQSFVRGARLADGRADTIALPIDDSFPAFLTALSQRQEELGILGYRLAVEQLEDVLLKLVESDDAQSEPVAR
jgi:ABC-type multidrug transport system ATPase subunit